jgi:hypothetical protein
MTTPYDDSFTGADSSAINAERWIVDGSPDIQGNTAELTYGERITNVYYLTGDFDIQVDFAMQSEPATDAWNYMLHCYIDATHRIGVGPEYESSRKFTCRYAAGGSYTSANVARTNTYGKLRLVRSGSNITAYYADGTGEFTALGTTHVVGSNSVQPFIFSTRWTGTPTPTCRFDNFLINSGYTAPSLTVTSGVLAVAGTNITLKLSNTHFFVESGALTINGTAVNLQYKTWAEQNHAQMFIPYLTGDAANSGLVVDLPVLTFESEGYTGITAYLTETLPVLESTGESSVWSSSEVDLPLLSSTGESGAMANFDIDCLTLSSTGYLNEIGELSETITIVSLSSTGYLNETCSLDSSLQVITLEAEGTTSLLGSSSLTLPMLEVSTISGYMIPVGTGSITLPVLATTKCGGVSGRFKYPVYNDL